MHWVFFRVKFTFFHHSNMLFFFVSFVAFRNQWLEKKQALNSLLIGKKIQFTRSVASTYILKILLNFYNFIFILNRTERNNAAN